MSAYTNKLTISSESEELRNILDFMKSERSILDVGKIVSMPESLHFSPTINARVGKCFNWLLGRTNEWGKSY